MSISLCVVARNEAAFLGACLESARAVVDEMVVVDTGSTDSTREVARRAGARLIHAPWPGDLGRAHNLPLKHARGEWILSLDGDEVLDPTSGERIPELVQTATADAYRLPIRNYTYYPPAKLRAADPTDLLTRGALAYIPTCVVRLFRRRRYRFSGQLHQSVSPSIVAGGGLIETSDVVIHHYGFLRFDRVKTSLYRILARRQAALTPDDARTWIDLGLIFSSRRQLPGSLMAFRRARALGRQAEASFLIARTLVEMGRPSEALPVLRQAIRLNSKDDAADFDRADAYELMGHALELQARKRDAERAYRSALGLRPASPGALNNLAGLLLERGKLSSAGRLLERLISAFPGLSTAWATLGALRLQQGELRAARRACEVALDIAPLNRPALVNLAVVHDRARRWHLAANARRAASELAFGDSSFPGGDVVPASVSGTRPRSRRSQSSGVISVISYLHGGSGRVLVDAVAALPDRRHRVLCLESGECTGQGLRRDLGQMGVRVETMASGDDVARAIGEAHPEVVLHHWSGGPPLGQPMRSGSERWIAIGHAPLPMPAGYDHYVVLSDFHAQFQTHLPYAQVHRITNAVSLRRFPRRVRTRRDPVTIAMLTRLDPGKFPRQLLAFLPPLELLGARLVIAGRGARRYEIEPELPSRGAPVTFIGPIASARVPAFLDQADIGLHLTEVHQETCSMTMLEMLAAGLPVVAEPKGCLPEMVISGENGFLAEDPNEIAARLTDLICSPALRRRLGASSRRRARAYAMEGYRRSLRALVEMACSEPQRPARARRSARDPEMISLGGWRPALTYLICTTASEIGARLASALLETGVAGLPEASFAPDRGWMALRGVELATFLAQVMEAGASPNGVFGALVCPEHLAALRDALGGGPGIARAFPNLHYVCIDGPGGRVPEPALMAWARVPGHRARRAIRVRLADVLRQPDRTARSVLRALGVRRSGVLM